MRISAPPVAITIVGAAMFQEIGKIIQSVQPHTQRLAGKEIERARGTDLHLLSRIFSYRSQTTVMVCAALLLAYRKARRISSRQHCALSASMSCLKLSIVSSRR